MQILSIRLKNIKSHRDLELDFAAGINVLSGPNGIGKSTIFEAIGYALFGVDAQSFVGNVERFLTIGTKRGEIVVDFSIEDEHFRVSRSVGPPAKWLLFRNIGDEFEVEEHKDGRETENRLKELLGLENSRSLAEQFELVIGPFQHDFLGPFVIKQQSKRRDRFDEILGIDSWRRTFSATSALLKAIQSRVSILESAIGPLRDQVELLPEKRRQLADVKKENDRVGAELKQQQARLSSLAENLTIFETLERQAKELDVEIVTLKERTTNGRDKIGGHKVLVAEAEKAQVVLNESKPGKDAFEQAERQMLKLRGDQEQQRLIERRTAELDKRLNGMIERYEAQQKGIFETEKEIVAERRELEGKRQELVADDKLLNAADELPEIRRLLNDKRLLAGQLDGRSVGLAEGKEKLAEGICPFFKEGCLNLGEKDPDVLFAGKIDLLSAEKKDLLVAISKLEEREQAALKAQEQIVQLKTRRQALEKGLERLEQRRLANEQRGRDLELSKREQVELREQLVAAKQEMVRFERLQSDIAQVEKELKAHQPARDLYVANLEQANKLPTYQAELAKFETLLGQLLQTLAECERALDEIKKNYDSDRHQQLRQQKETVSRDVGVLGEKLKGLDADNHRLKAEIESLKQVEAEIAAKQKQIKNYGQKETLVKFLRNRVFRNVSTALSQRFREEISRRANSIYRIIADVDEELVWGDNYQIVLRDMSEGQLRERADDQLSGGQTMSAVVALRLAMLQTIGARIAFFDEPTSNLDASRRENLAHAFRAIDVGKEEVTEHWYDQLFLISHDVAFTEVTDQIVDLERSEL